MVSVSESVQVARAWDNAGVTSDSKTLKSRGRSFAMLATTVLLLLTGCGVSKSGSSFRIGWYTYERTGTANLATYRGEGVNLMVAYHSSGGYTAKWMRATAAQGIQVLLQPDPEWVRSGNIAALSAFVRRYDHTPSLYGWYLYDEPDAGNLRPARLQAAYDAIKAIDTHPVAVVFTTGGCRFGPGAIDAGYLAGFDLLMFDYYPFYRNLRVSHPALHAQRNDQNCVQSAREYRKSGPIIVVQSFGSGQHTGPFQWRDPSYTETECQVALAEASGATGVLFWDDQISDAHVRRDSNRIIRHWHSGYAQAVASGGISASNCLPGRTRLGTPTPSTTTTP